jgi:hypothetical protein
MNRSDPGVLYQMSPFKLLARFFEMLSKNGIVVREVEQAVISAREHIWLNVEEHPLLLDCFRGVTCGTLLVSYVCPKLFCAYYPSEEMDRAVDLLMIFKGLRATELAERTSSFVERDLRLTEQNAAAFYGPESFSVSLKGADEANDTLSALLSTRAPYNGSHYHLRWNYDDGCRKLVWKWMRDPREEPAENPNPNSNGKLKRLAEQVADDIKTSAKKIASPHVQTVIKVQEELVRPTAAPQQQVSPAPMPLVLTSLRVRPAVVPASAPTPAASSGGC